MPAVLEKVRPALVGLVAVAVVAAWSLGSASRARADETWLLTLEGAGLVPITAPQSDWFGPGFTGAIGLHRSLAPWVSLGLRVRGAVLADGDAPDDPTLEDPGHGSLYTGLLALRLRPLASSDDARRGTGLWLEGAGGGGFTGDEEKWSFEAAIGWAFPVGAVDLGPVLRYIQIFQPDDALEDRDARLAVAGLELTLFDARARAEAPVDATPVPSDIDGDGILDMNDQCPREPEDRDGYEDEDGCPEPDNDNDGIPDARDNCPVVPEDRDNFEDEDGCPETDNDADGILDPNDACPNEAEVINGVEDQDGCPDEGLIQMVGDRIVLEERVLFEFERARVRHAARPVIDAIVHLWRQHPEWTRLKVEGHADVRGDATYNQRLSERRAANVMRALVNAGIPADIIESEGFGNTRPLSAETTEQAHQLNRRVEFVVVAGHSSHAQTPAEDGPTHALPRSIAPSEGGPEVEPLPPELESAPSEGAPREEGDR